MSAGLFDGSLEAPHPRHDISSIHYLFIHDPECMAVQHSTTLHAFKDFDVIKASSAIEAQPALAKGVAYCW